MSDFYQAFNNYILPNEGYFANLTGDPGGETYSGIARNLNPNWNGWPIVDSYVNAKGGIDNIKNNERIPAADSLVADFYLNLWKQNQMDKIVNPDVANIIFDFIVNSGSGIAVKHVQRILGVVDDGVIGQKTLSAINTYNPQLLFNTIKDDRASFYTQLASKSENYARFLQGWLTRLGTFDFNTATGIGVGLFLIIGIVITFLTLKNE